MSLLGALTQEEFCIQCLGINFSHQVCPSPLGWQMSSQAATTGRTFLQVVSKQFLGEGLKELLLGTGAMGLHWAINSPQLLCSPGQAQCRHQGLSWSCASTDGLAGALTALVWTLGIP